MGTPHKHAEIIKAWADGGLVQYRSCMEWRDQNNPSFSTDYEWRIKPEPKLDVVRFYRIEVYSNDYTAGKERVKTDNLKLTFDGETGKLKAAEVLK